MIKFNTILAKDKLVTKRKLSISRKKKHDGTLARVIRIDPIIVQAYSKKLYYILDNWVDNPNPDVVYKRNDNLDFRQGIFELSRPKKVYSYWTPFVLGKKVIIKINKDERGATFIKGSR